MAEILASLKKKGGGTDFVLVVTYSEDYYGATITVTDGTTTLSDTATSSGELEFSIPNEGEWTVSATVSGSAVSQDVTIDNEFTTELPSLVPQGSTVTPTDDIQTWLKCANIKDKSYTTLAEVLDDRDTFETLLRDSNACDYMARSTTWAVNTVSAVPTMTNYTTPSGIVGYSSEFPASGGYSYNAWKAFNGTDVDQYDCWASANNATYPQYIDYEFPNPVCINRVEYYTRNYNESSSPKDVDLQAYDGSAWITLGSNTSTVATLNTKVGFSVNNYQKYSKYRFNIRSKNGSSPAYVSVGLINYFEPDITTNQDAMALLGKYDYACDKLLSNSTWCDAICNSDYWDRVLVSKVPQMTSNTTPEGEVFTLNSHSSYTSFAYQTFNGGFWADADNSTNSAVGYKFIKPFCIKRFTVEFAAGRNPSAFAIQASNNGTNWTELFKRTGNTSSSFDEYIDNTEYYLYYRLYKITGSSTYNTMYTNGVQFYGSSPKTVYKELIPIMTSNTTPSGEVIYSSIHSSPYDAYKAFDGDDTTTRWNGSNSANQEYIGYHFTKPVCVKKVHLRIYVAGNPKTQMFKTGKIQGSNDGTDWTDLKSIEYENHTSVSTDYWDVDEELTNTDSYEYYRILCTDSYYKYSNYNCYSFYTIQFYDKTVQSNIIHSAANDTIYYYSDSSPVVIATTNSEGNGICDFSQLEDGIYTLYSTVAKNPNDLTLDYTKRVRITKSVYGGTTELYMFPDTVSTLYWYGSIGDNLEELSSASGWSYTGYTFQSPTYDTNKIRCNSASGKLSGVGTKNKVSGITKLIAQGITIYNGAYGFLMDNSDKSLNSAVEAITFTNNALSLMSLSSHSDINISVWSNATRVEDVYGLWYDKILSATPTYTSAANDTLYVLSGSSRVWLTNTNGEGKSYDPLLPPGTYTIYSSIAKDPNNLSNDYSKVVTVTSETRTINVMPEGNILYWYGYKTINLNQAVSSSASFTESVNQITTVTASSANNVYVWGYSDTIENITNNNKMKVIASTSVTNGGFQINIQNPFAAQNNNNIVGGVDTTTSTVNTPLYFEYTFLKDNKSGQIRIGTWWTACAGNLYALWID